MVVLSNNQSAEVGFNTDENMLFRSFEDFLALDYERPLFFEIESVSLNYIEETIWKIRSHSKYFYFLCFVNGDINGKITPLIDGINLPIQEKSEQLELFEGLLGSFKVREESLSRDERLLKYLWLRPDYIVRPLHEWSYRRFYKYPLLDALSFNEVDSFEWIQSLIFNKMFVKHALVDRQRECAKCRSTHLSFVDVCPNCSSMAITEQIALHCFTCGQVGPQQEFLRQGALICPKCETHLKHIGSDYDRPIENYSCSDCEHFFSEGDILARCAECAESSDTEELIAHEVYSYKLSEQGKIIALRGPISDVLQIFSGKNFVASEVFLHDIDWLLLQSDRYKEVKFSVMGLYFENLHKVMQATSQINVLQKVEAIAERVRELLRDTDLCMRSNENVVWILLPQTDDNGLSQLKNRLNLLADDVQQDANQQLKLICKYTSYFSAQRIEKEPAELLLARLYNNIL